jgi:hypothetical protein
MPGPGSADNSIATASPPQTERKWHSTKNLPGVFQLVLAWDDDTTLSTGRTTS